MKTRERRIAVDGERLRAIREERGISLRQFAIRLDVSAATMSGIETGRTRVSIDRLARIATLLESPAASLAAEDAAHGTQTFLERPHWRAYPPIAFDTPLMGALEAFLEFGYHGASTREIAQRAGMSVPGLYHHYPTKQHMLVAFIDYVMEEILWRAEAARAEGQTPAEQFALMVENLTLFHAARRELGFLGSSELRSLEPAALTRNRRLRRQHQQMLDDATDAGVAAGEFRSDDPRGASRAVVSLCVALPLWYRLDGPSTPQEVARQYVGYALQLIGYVKSREALLKRLKVGTIVA